MPHRFYLPAFSQWSYPDPDRPVLLRLPAQADILQHCLYTVLLPVLLHWLHSDPTWNLRFPLPQRHSYCSYFLCCLSYRTWKPLSLYPQKFLLMSFQDLLPYLLSCLLPTERFPDRNGRSWNILHIPVLFLTDIQVPWSPVLFRPVSYYCSPRQLCHFLLRQDRRKYCTRSHVPQTSYLSFQGSYYFYSMRSG